MMGVFRISNRNGLGFVLVIDAKDLNKVNYNIKNI